MLPLAPIAPAHVRYIKLGQGGAWEGPSLDGGRIDFGFDEADPALVRADDWDAVRAHYVALGSGPVKLLAEAMEG